MATEKPQVGSRSKKSGLLVSISWMLVGLFVLIALGVGILVAFAKINNGLGLGLIQKPGLDAYRLDDFNWIAALILMFAVVVVLIVGGWARLRRWMQVRALFKQYEKSDSPE